MLNEFARKQVPHLPGMSFLEDDHVTDKLQFMDAAHGQRVYAEAFVQDSFYKAFHARLNSFYPVLLSTLDAGGDFTAVAGIRPAGSEKLFSEYYLEKPIEDILGVNRRKVVEFGNLATASAGQARFLIITLSAFIHGAGFSHVVFTVVPALYNAFRRMGLPLTKLADARKDMLPKALSREWGSYYERKPMVYSGDLTTGWGSLQAIARRNPALYKASVLAAEAGYMFSRNNAVVVA